MKDQTEKFLKELANHQLELVVQGPPITAFYLKDPAQGRMMSTLIMFTPEGISLSGDLTPSLNGVHSAYKCTLNWFSGVLAPEYLCSKFLQKVWVPEACRKELEEWVNDPATEPEDGCSKEEAEERIDEAIEEGDQFAVRDICDELGFDTSDGIPGYTYNPTDAGLLCAIQRKFAELHQKRPREFFIIDKSVRSDMALWWKPNNSGYTVRLESAGRYSLEQVQKNLSYYNNDSTLPVPVETVRSACVSVVPNESKTIEAFKAASSEALANEEVVQEGSSPR